MVVFPCPSTQTCNWVRPTEHTVCMFSTAVWRYWWKHLQQGQPVQMGELGRCIWHQIKWYPRLKKNPWCFSCGFVRRKWLERQTNYISVKNVCPRTGFKICAQLRTGLWEGDVGEALGAPSVPFFRSSSRTFPWSAAGGLVKLNLMKRNCVDDGTEMWLQSMNMYVA